VVSRTFRIIVVIVAGLAAVAVFYPVNQQRIINVGTDEYAAHHALYGKRIKSQVITINGKLRGIGAVLVNLRRASQLTGVKVAVYTVDNELLAEQDIPDEDIKDDSIAWTNFSDLDIPGRQVRVDFSAPEATKDNPVGLRFELGSPEELALAVRERVPFWRAARQFFVQLVIKPFEGGIPGRIKTKGLDRFDQGAQKISAQKEFFVRLCRFNGNQFPAQVEDFLFCRHFQSHSRLPGARPIPGQPIFTTFGTIVNTFLSLFPPR